MSKRTREKVEKMKRTPSSEMMTAVLPCPFCKNNTIDYWDEVDRFFYCEPCGLCGPRGKDMGDALKKWNAMSRISEGF